jgi:hypothetical protein
MKVYKKVLPYLLAAAPLVMTSCVERTTEKGVVQKINEEKWVYCDKDGDSLVDYRVYVSDGSISFYDYIREGDTIVFDVYFNDVSGKSISISSSRIKSVNNHSRDDLKKIYQINRLRTKVGQPKMR